jgi:hypothetical protein
MGRVMVREKKKPTNPANTNNTPPMISMVLRKVLTPARASDFG